MVSSVILGIPGKRGIEELVSSVDSKKALNFRANIESFRFRIFWSAVEI